jgi:hypothetical protein
MEFAEHLKIKIVDNIQSKPVNFKAYLTDSNVDFKLMDQTMAYAPLSFRNNKIHTRTTISTKLSFDILAESHAEAISNYQNLDFLLEAIKPQYTVINQQYLPDLKNSFGLISLMFRGLKPLEDSKFIYLEQFEYRIIKDMGFITTTDQKLMPIGFSLSIGGRILQEFKENVRGIYNV